MKNNIIRTIIMLLVSFVVMSAGTAHALVYRTGTDMATENVKSKSSDTYNVKFVQGYTAGVFVSGDGDTDLDLYVYGANDDLICSSTTNGDDEFCTFDVYRTSYFRIKIVNRGRVSNNYQLLCN